MKVAALNKQSGGLFIAGESRAHQARPGSMRSEAEADGESCHPDQKVLTDKVKALFFYKTFFHRGVTCSPQTADPLSLRDIPLTGGPS